MHKRGEVKRGAGILPFAVRGDELFFLFHTTFKGRRRGLLVDFGGGSRSGESAEETAAREFIEETEGMYLGDKRGLREMPASEFERQRTLILQRIVASRADHPGHHCRRGQAAGKRRRDWQVFFVAVDYRPVGAINRAWAEDDGRRFRKRRKLVWVAAPRLLEIYRKRPEQLWTRLREYEDAAAVISAIGQVSPAS